LCIDQWGDQPARGAYYYLSRLEPIAISEQDGEGGWTERAPDGEQQALWEFAEQTGERLRGTWRQGRRSLPFELSPLGRSSTDETEPCASDDFLGPRIAGGEILAGPAELDGWRYTALTFRPPSHFAEDLSLEGFSFEPQEPGDVAINQALSAAVPMPARTIDEDILQCLGHAIAVGGRDGFFALSIRPTMAARRFLTVEVGSGDYCGGAHPNHDTFHQTYDRTTGEEVRLDAWFGAPDASGGVVTAPELRAMAMAKWPARDDQEECREVAAANQYWRLALAREGVVFTPSFPHALKACEESALLTWEELAPFLNETGRAGLARLRGE
jgi:hypothetical protein